MAYLFKPVSIKQSGASFPVRRMDFDMTGAEKYFINHDPVPTALWVAFQAFFPEGEQFFVDAVRDRRWRIKDPRLQKDASAFIGQESMHGKEHRAVNAEVKRQGLNVYPLDRAVRHGRKWGNRYLPSRFRLALTAALEHYTGVIGKQVALRPDFRASIIDERAKVLLLWHAMEETEHRAVAFDVYQQTGGDYATRVLAMTLVNLGIAPIILNAMLFCLRQLGEQRNFASWRRFLRDYWGPRGFFTQAIPELLRYYRPGFHPNEDDPETLLAIFRHELGIDDVALTG